MKTPKVATPKPKLKFNTPKSGLVRKSLGNNPTASLKKLSTKGKEQVLSMVKDNEENVEFKNKTPKKARMSLPANALRNSKPNSDNLKNAKTPKKSPKTKKPATPDSPKSGKKNNASDKIPSKDSPVTKPQSVKKTPQNKNVPQDVKTPASVENNSSPVKQNVESKKNKVPFNLDDSLAIKTPNGLNQKKGTSPGKEKLNSPEVELGLQLEEALSPKSKKEKKKKMSLGLKVTAQGKVAVNKKVVKKLDITSSDSVVDSDSKNKPSDSVADSDSKKKKRKRRRRKPQSTESKSSFLKHTNALNAVKALLKAPVPKKDDLLSEDDYIYLQFNLVKQSKEARGVYKVLLPHCILPDLPEVCLIVADLKGKRDEPEEAIDHYKELLKNNDITSITEIIPLRKLKREYSQFEERRKLANKFDCIINDSRVTRFAQLGKRFARAKKCICPVKLDSKTLKEDVAKALRKVVIFSSGQGTSFSVKCGHSGMSPEDIADNIVAIGDFLANNETMIGSPLNVNTALIKKALSTGFPVYVSTVTPNEVDTPKGKQRKVEEPVEDEVTTVPDATVVVYPSGNVKVKKRKNEEDKDDAEVKQKGNKKAKTNASKKVKVETNSSDDEVDGGDSDAAMDSSNDEDDSAIDSLNGTDDEASDDESEVEVEDDDDDEGDDDDDEEDEDDDGDDDESVDEEEIEAAEKAYLEELRLLQEEIGKKKTKKSGKTADPVEIKEGQVKQQDKKVAAKGGKKQEKKGLQNEQKVQNKKNVLKEQDTNATKGKKFEKQNQVKGSQNNLPKKNLGASPQNQLKGNENQNQKKNKLGSPQNQLKGNQNQFPKKNKFDSPQNQKKGNQNQNQKKNKFGSPQNQQKGKSQQFGKGPNKGIGQKGGSPKQRKKQFKKGPIGKNKN